jgi:hypothetical protein
VKVNRSLNEEIFSDGEVWAAIRYLDPEARPGVAGLLVSVALCWLILFLSAIYLSFHLQH